MNKGECNDRCERFLADLVKSDPKKREWIKPDQEKGCPRLWFTRLPKWIKREHGIPPEMFVVDIDREDMCVWVYLWIESNDTTPVQLSERLYTKVKTKIDGTSARPTRRLEGGAWTREAHQNQGFWLGFRRGAPPEERDWPACHREVLDDIEWLEREVGPHFRVACASPDRAAGRVQP
ncbi:MAG: hypothetical protein HYZ53_20850 [Planctomycetes bacterium]|nr:hypothetical protein [Planctomycetota bacterium]